MVRLETIRKDEADTPTYLPEPPGCKMTEWIQSQTTYAEISKMETGEYTARVVKQKIWVVDTCYELQEIYGIDGGGNDGGGLTAEGHPVNDDSGKVRMKAVQPTHKALEHVIVGFVQLLSEQDVDLEASTSLDRYASDRSAN